MRVERVCRWDKTDEKSADASKQKVPKAKVHNAWQVFLLPSAAIELGFESMKPINHKTERKEKKKEKEKKKKKKEKKKEKKKKVTQTDV